MPYKSGVRMVNSEEHKTVFKGKEMFMDLVTWTSFYLNFSSKITSGMGKNQIAVG